MICKGNRPIQSIQSQKNMKAINMKNIKRKNQKSAPSNGKESILLLLRVKITANIEAAIDLVIKKNKDKVNLLIYQNSLKSSFLEYLKDIHKKICLQWLTIIWVDYTSAIIITGGELKNHAANISNLKFNLLKYP